MSATKRCAVKSKTEKSKLPNNIYEYHQGEGVDHPLFLFSSSTGLEYGVRFDHFPFDFPNVDILRTISVFCNTENLPPNDFRVGITICDIIENYVINNPHEVVTYVCDNLDGKGRIRQDKFKRWYTSYSNGHLLAFPHLISTPSDEIHTCIIFHPNVYDEDTMVASYKNEIESMNTIKE